MNYKFIQPVSMQVNQEQFDHLSKELEKLGYIPDNLNSGTILVGVHFLVTQYRGTNKNFSNSASRYLEEGHYFIDHYNPELFLALAAMTDNPSRRATKEEIIAGFTKKEEFVLPEKWCIKSSEASFEKLINWFSNKLGRKVAGETVSYFHLPEIQSNVCTASYVGKNYQEITFEQFKKHVLKTETMNKKIIGYKAPYDIYTETAYFKINKGDLLVKDSFPLYYKCVNWKVGECAKYLLAKEIVETWEPVYEEDKKLKIFTLDCLGPSKFELEVSTDGILYRLDSAYLSINDLYLLIDMSRTRSLSAKGRSDAYQCQFSHIDLGCKKSVPIIQLKEVVDYYNSIKL